MKNHMGLKRWDKMLAVFLCMSMTLAEPVMTAAAAPVAEEVTVEQGGFGAEEYGGEDSVSGDSVSTDGISENGTSGGLSDNTVSQDEVSENRVSSDTVSDDEVEYTYLTGVQPDDLVIDSLEDQIGDAGSIVARSASLYEDVTGAEIPEKYDARNVDGKSYVTPARDQLESQLCWAFSMASVVESNMIKKGFASADSLQISPDHLGYFFYHHVDDELGGTKGASVQIGRDDYYKLGGNSTCGTLELANWVGPVEESKARFSTGPQEHDDSLAYDDIAHMQNAYWVKASDRSYIKSLIMEYGSATINCVMSTSGIQKCEDGTASYLYAGRSSVGHAVTIVGWDDNYPASNFKSFGSSDSEKNGQPAKENGAWLIKDSYGDKGNRVDGCFYMSYEDSALQYDSTKAIAYDMESANNYDHNYQYDGAYGLRSIAFSNSIYGANVYQAKGNQRENGAERIGAVSFATDGTDASYSIQIYTNLQSPDTDPTSGTRAFTSPQTGSFAYAGYHTIKLNTPVVVREGEYFSVVISLNKDGGNVSLMTDESYENDAGWAIHTAALERGRSFYGSDGSAWIDAYDRVANGVERPSVLRIKAFTQNYEIQGPFYVDKDMVADIPAQTYTGDPILPEIKVYYDGKELKEGEDFQATYGRNVTVGKNSGSVVIRGIGNYITETAITKHFDIVKKDISDEDITVAGLDSILYYNGEEHKPVTVYHKGRLLDSRSVKITYKQNKNVGTASVVIKGSGNYTGSRTETFNIKLHDISVSGSISVNQIRDEQYLAKPIEVRPVVRNLETGAVLKLNQDYTLLYKNNVMPGTAKVTVAGKGGYTGKLEAEFKIRGKDISKLPMTAIKAQTYNGGLAIRPDVIIKDGSETLKENVHFSAVYTDNINVGTATIRIEGREGTIYEGSSKVVPFVISPVNIATGTKMSRFGDKTFVNGLSAYTQDPILSLPDGRTLTKDRDYTIKYTNNTSKGTATMTINAIGPNYSGAIVRNFQITDKICLTDYSDSNLTVTGFTYDRRYMFDKRSLDKNNKNTFEAKPELAISYRGVRLEEGKDYTITYRNYDKVGTAQAIITAASGSRFYGTRTEEYYIVGRPIFPLGLDVGFFLNDPVDKVYTGGEIKQNINLIERIRKENSNRIISYKRKEGITYKVDYRDNVNVGTATYTITGINDYSGSQEFEFKIEPRDLSTCTATTVKTQIYTGEPIYPNIYLKLGNRYLVEGRDYEEDLTCSGNNVEAGTASIVYKAVEGSQNFVGTKTVTFKIKKRSLGALKYGENIRISSLNGEDIRHLTTDYDGTQKMPVPEIICDGKDISDQCAITYGENRKVGYGTITLTALPETGFSGKKVIRFKIKGKPFNVATSYDGEEFTYTGKAIRPSVDELLTLDGEVLIKGRDYKIKYKKSINAGYGYFYLQGLGDYKGSGKILRYTIQRHEVEDCIIRGLDKPVRRGTQRVVRPNFTVTVDGRRLRKGKDYTVTYLNNRAAGTGTVHVRFVGNYEGEYSQQFTIR